jgi:hypothetical protein
MLVSAPDRFIHNLWLGEFYLMAVQRVWYNEAPCLAPFHFTDTSEFLAFGIVNEKLLIWQHRLISCRLTEFGHIFIRCIPVVTYSPDL